MSGIIRNEGYIARPVTSVRQAVNAIEIMPPSLILMDISMPDIDGYVFCSMLKKNAITRDIPVIFISALNSVEDRVKGFRAGAVDYISKPFDIEEVTFRINIHLKMYKSKHELEINNKKLYTIINNQIKKIYEEQKNVMNAIAMIAAHKDVYIAPHLDHVGKNSRLLAMSLQLSSKYSSMITAGFMEVIELAAPLHDIGKMIINKSSLQSKEDIIFDKNEYIKSHVLTGATLLKDIYSTNEQNEFIKLSIEIAKYHHENWDGTGYLEGLSGTDIPLSARIVSIVNQYDLLVNDMNYGKAHSPGECVRIINEGSGTLFDPDIVEVFNKIHNQLKY